MSLERFVLPGKRLEPKRALQNLRRSVKQRELTQNSRITMVLKSYRINTESALVAGQIDQKWWLLSGC